MIRKHTVIAATVAALMAPTSTLAETFELTVRNLTEADVTNIRISGGKVTGSKSVRAGANKAVAIQLPDGECVADIELSFSDSTSATAEGFDLCENDVLPITQVY